MMRHYSKTYQIGKFSVSISYNDIIVLYKGNKKIYFKKLSRIPRVSIRPLHKKIAMCSLPLLVGAVLVVGVGRDAQRRPVSDEERKNMIVISNKTDFSSPDENTAIVIRTHRVKKGETLSHIARDYGVSMDTICGSNSLVSYDILPEGIVLRIPSRDGILHTVKKGQNLLSIARQYRIHVEKVLSQNSLKNGDFVAVGDVIFVPDAKPLDIVPGFLWPAACRAVTSGYGWRRNPFNCEERDFHRGIDIRSNYQWVKATKYGKVTFAGWLGGYGRAVLIAHPNGWKSLYGHLSRILVREGQYVRQGQYVGKSGNTGYSSGPHLHFELIHNGRHVNPYRYIK